MKTSKNMIYGDEFILTLKGNPCKNCLVRPVCTKEFNQTACKKYVDFILDLVKEAKNGNKKEK